MNEAISTRVRKPGTRIKKTGVPASRAPTASPAAFPCPSCGGGTIVYNSRASGSTRRRSRSCVECGTRFHTHEVIVGDTEETATASVRQAIRLLRVLANNLEISISGKVEP